MRTVTPMLLMVALLLAAGCGPPQAPVVSEVWSDGEFSRLEIEQQGVVIAEWTTQASLTDDGWQLASETSGDGFYELVTVSVRRGDLTPESTEYLGRGPGGEVTFLAVYGEDEVSIAAERPDGQQTATVKLPPPPYFDNEQFTFMIRGLPLAQGYRAKIPMVITRTASKGEFVVKVVGRERVTVPAGEFEAWKIEMVGLNQFAWVAVSPPHQLVRHENVPAGTTSVLVEYRPH